MRRKREILGLAAAAFAASVLGSLAPSRPASAATLQWDADGATAGILDGAGTWSTAGNWWDPVGLTNTNWVNTTTDVIFGGNGSTGTPGLVKITASTTPKSLTFNVDGYTIEDSANPNRLILSQTGGITANGNATIRTFRGAVMLTGSQTFTVAPNKTLLFDNTPEAANILIGGNSTASPIQNVEGGGTIDFQTATTAFTFGVPQTTTLNVNNGTVRAVTKRASDNSAFVIRARSNATTIQPGRAFVGPNGVIDLGTGSILIQQANDTPAANQPAGELYLNGGLLKAGDFGGGVGSPGRLFINGGEIRATMNTSTFIREQWAFASTNDGPEFMRIGTSGGNVNTDGFDIGIATPFSEDPASLGGGFTKKGAGTLTTTAANTYTGGTTIQAGTLKLGNGGTSGSILGNVANSGTLAFNRSDAFTFAGTISGTGGITQVGPGLTLITSAANSFTGESRVTGGTLDFNDNATFASTSGIVVNANGAAGVETGSLDPAFIAKINAGSGPSVGAIALASVNAAANIDFTAAPLNGTNSAGMSVGALGFITYTGTITPNPAVGYRVGGGGTLTLPNTNALTGANNVTVTNGGTVVVAGSNDYSGTTTIDGLTTLSVAGGASLGDASATNDIVFNGGNLLTTGGVNSPARDVTLTAAGGTIDTAGNDSTLGNLSGAGNFNKLSTGKLTVNHVRSANLNVADGTIAIAPNSTAAGVSKVATLTLGPTAKIDLTDNKLITSSPLGTWNGSNYTDVSGMVDVGRGDASSALWDGATGIVTSDTRAVNNNDLVSIGTASAANVKGVDSTATATFAGQTVLGSDTIAMVTWGGDANLDGKINILDYGQIDFNVASSGSVFGWYNGDFNYDGKINILDYGIIDFNVGAQNSVFASGGSGGGIEGVAAVPEPASIGLIGIAAASLLGRRRRTAR